MCNSLEIFDDRLVEEDEIISVTASFEQNTAEISLISNSASMIITDNDCKNCLEISYSTGTVCVLMQGSGYLRNQS